MSKHTVALRDETAFEYVKGKLLAQGWSCSKGVGMFTLEVTVPHPLDWECFLPQIAPLIWDGNQKSATTWRPGR